MTKRLLAALVCVALVAALLPRTVLADHVSTKVLYFDDKKLLMSDFPGGVKEPYPDDGTWSVNEDTLTLENFNFTTSAPTALSMKSGATLEIKGSNSLTSTYHGDDVHDYFVCGLHNAGQLTVCGSGTLTVTGGSGGSRYNCYGIFSSDLSELTIESGTIKVNAGTSAKSSIGIQIGKLTMTGGTLTAYGNTSALHSGISGNCLTVGPAGAGKGLMCGYSGHVGETDWSDKILDAVYEGYDVGFNNASGYYSNPSVRISEVSAVSGTVKDAANHPVDGFRLYLNGTSPRDYMTGPASGEYRFYVENGTYTLSAEKDRTIGTRSIAVNGAALSGQDITLENAPTPGITVLPAATFHQGGAPDYLTLLVGNTGDTPNRAPHFGSLEISGDNTNFTTVDSANYSLQYGSIRIELKKFWLDTLTPGIYTLRVNLAGVYAGISPTTRLIVTASGGDAGGQESDAPKTGDAATPMLWLVIALLAGAGLAASAARRRRVEKRR